MGGLGGGEGGGIAPREPYDPQPTPPSDLLCGWFSATLTVQAVGAFPLRQVNFSPGGAHGCPY